MCTKLAGVAGHVQRISQMSTEELKLNSIKCLAKNYEYPTNPKMFSCTLIVGIAWQSSVLDFLDVMYTSAGVVVPVCGCGIATCATTSLPAEVTSV